MEYHVQLTSERYKKASMEYNQINNVMIKLIVFLSIIIFIFYLIVNICISYILNITDSFNSLATMLTLGVVISVVFSVMFSYSLDAIATRSGEKTSKLNGAFRNKVVEVGKDGIETTIEDGSSSFYPKSRVRNIYETNTFFIVKLNTAIIIIFEKDKMNHDQVNEPRTILSSYLDKKMVVTNI